MSHETHGWDVYGAYNANCPDCNSPWFRAVKALLEYHFPVSMNGILICDKCNKPGGGDKLWPCDTAGIISREIGPEVFDRMMEERHGHSRPGAAAGGADPVPEGATDTLRGPEPVRGVPGAESGHRTPNLSEWLRTPSVCEPLPRSEDGPGLPTVGSVPELTWKQCGNRRRPSSVEKCGMFLVQVNGWWVCVEHGARSKVK